MESLGPGQGGGGEKYPGYFWKLLSKVQELRKSSNRHDKISKVLKIAKGLIKL